MTTLVVLFVSVIIASHICSMSEAAILSLPMIRARILYDQNRRNSRDVLYLKENIGLVIATIVIVNNAVNIAGSVFVGQKAVHIFGDQALGLAATILTFMIIIVGEIIPKRIGEHHKIAVSLFIAKPLKWTVLAARPLIEFLINITNPFIKTQKHPRVTEDEIRMMLRWGRDAGTVETDEELFCQRVFRLNDLRAFQIMRPIEHIFALPADKSVGELREQIIQSRYSRIAVFDKDPRDFVGMVQHRVLLRAIAEDRDGVRVGQLMTEPIFVNWFTRADELLEKFLIYHQHLFIVQDTRGKDVGLVTMEDVLEELFGEIYDEKDVSTSRGPGPQPAGPDVEGTSPMTSETTNDHDDERTGSN